MNDNFPTGRVLAKYLPSPSFRHTVPLSVRDILIYTQLNATVAFGYNIEDLLFDIAVANYFGKHYIVDAFIDLHIDILMVKL